MTHQLQSSLFLPLEPARVFAFFCDPGNLALITPPEMQFRMITPGPIRMGAGTVIDYRIRALGLPLRWRSLIETWDPPHVFVDVQLKGPYRRWIHTHRFRAAGGGTHVEDVVEYALPLWPCGELAQPLVRRQLEHIFAFRSTAIERLLLGNTQP
ncbi:MAG: CDP-paratose 2-epimerase [Pirellulales bacterium]